MSKTVDELAVEFGVHGHQALEGAMHHLNETAQELTSTLKRVALGWISVELWKETIEKSVEMAESLHKLSQRTGETAENLSRLNFAANLSHVSADELSGGLRFLARNMMQAADGTGPAADAFKTLKIHATDAHGALKPLMPTMLAIADRFRDMPDGVTKTALAMAVFGRSGASLIPILNKGSEGIRDLARESDALGATMSDKQVKALLEYEDGVKRAKGAIDGLARSIITPLLPALTAGAEELAHMAKGAHSTSGELTGLQKVIDFLARGALGLQMSLQGVVSLMKVTWAAIVTNPIDAARGKETPFSRALKQADKDLTDLADKLEINYRKIMGLWGMRHPEAGNSGGRDTPELQSGAADQKAAQAARAAHDLAMEAARDHYDKLIGLADNWVAQMKKKYGADSKEYIDAQRERQKIAMDYARDVQAETFRRGMAAMNAQFDLQLDQAGINYEQQLALAQSHLAAIAYLYGTQSAEYAEMQRRILAIQKESLTAQEGNERDHQEMMNRFAREEEARQRELKRKEKEAAREVADDINTVITGVFQDGGVTGAARALGSKILKELGTLMLEQGGIYEAYGAIMQSLSGMLTNPFTAGPAALAIGAALIALGSALGASGHASAARSGGSVGRGGYSGGFTATTVVPPVSSPTSAGANTRNLTARAPVTVNATIIGKDDPRAQREILELIARAERRGETSG